MMIYNTIYKRLNKYEKKYVLLSIFYPCRISARINIILQEMDKL